MTNPTTAAEIRRLTEALAEMTRCRDNALRALYRDDVETDIDLEETIEAPFYGPGWDWDEPDLQAVVKEAAGAVRPAFGKLTQQRDKAREQAREFGELIALRARLDAPAAVPSVGGAVLRDRIAALFRCPPGVERLGDATPGEIADAVLTVLPAPADRAAVLTEAERTMLTYALDQAQEHIWSRDGFTEEDQAAVTSLRRLAGGAAGSSSPEFPGPKFKETAGNLNRAGGAAPNTGTEASTAAAYLSTPCDACEHTLNWHRNDVGCVVARCVCGRFQPPAEEPRGA